LVAAKVAKVSDASQHFSKDISETET